MCIGDINSRTGIGFFAGHADALIVFNVAAANVRPAAAKREGRQIMCLDAGSLAVLVAVAVSCLRIPDNAATGTGEHRHALEVCGFDTQWFFASRILALGALLDALMRLPRQLSGKAA